MARKAPARTSIAQTVRTYIDARPVVRDALRMGIVNLSALSRKIMEETGLRQEEAVLVACRRYPLGRKGPGYEAAIRDILDRSKLEVRTRVAVWTLRSSWQLVGRLEKAIPRLQAQGSGVHLLHGSESVTVIADEGVAPVLEETLDKGDILRTRRGLVEVNLRTPASVEDVQGLLAFLTSSLASRGVNFVEVVSCHKDNMFVIEEDDLFAAFQLLNGLIRA